MVKDFIFIRMEKVMRGHGQMVLRQEKESTNIIMVIFTKVIGAMELGKVTGPLLIPRVIFIKVIGKMTLKQERVY